MRFYRLLLFAFPRHIRRDFGDEMVRMFEAQLATARAEGRGRLGVWLAGATDAVIHGFGERLAARTPRDRANGWSVQRWRCLMDRAILDLRHAVRLSIAQPGVTLVAVLTLALGIGANTAIFSAVDAVLLRALPYEEPDRIVMVWEKRDSEGERNNAVAPADYLDWARMNTVFSAIAGLTPLTADLTGTGNAVRLFAAGVSAPFFDVFGVQPAAGRFFRADEEQVGRHRVVVLGHALWRQRFGADPSIVGRSLLLNGIPHEVVGVLPPTFEFPDSTIELWAPLALEGGSQPPSRASHFLNVYARLKPGVTLEQARVDMDRLGAHLAQEYPETNRLHGAWVSPLADELTEPVRAGLLLCPPRSHSCCSSRA